MVTNIFARQRWSPYVVGIGIGALSWVTFAFMGKALGTSTTLVHAAGVAERVVAPDRTDANEYFAKYIGTTAEPQPVFEWQFALVIMLAVGAFIAARLAKSTFRETVPDLWKWRFGSSKLLRYTAAFLGGAVLLFGARLAGGCTSGHGISGGLQLALSSYVFLIAMFISGIASAFLLFGKAGRSHV